MPGAGTAGSSAGTDVGGCVVLGAGTVDGAELGGDEVGGVEAVGLAVSDWIEHPARLVMTTATRIEVRRLLE